MSGACLGEVAAALVDGQLDHAARERAQRHLAHCAACRAEVDAQRRLKARLSGLADAPAPPDALAVRLLSLPPPGAVALPPGPVRVGIASGPRATRPAGRRPSPRAAAATAVLALGVVALALGGRPTPTTTPVDPTTERFVVQHVDTTSGSTGAVRASLSGRGAP